MKTDYLLDAFDNQPIRIVSGKKYCINPITDHVPLTSSELLHQIVDEASAMVDFEKADFIVGEEDRGGYLSALMAFAWSKPFTLTKWNPAGLEGEVSIGFRNAYTNGNLYLNGIREMQGKKVIIVEDIIDTGGTLIAMIDLLRKNGVEVVDVVCVAEKTDYQGKEKVERETGIVPKVLISFASEGDFSKVTNRHNR